MLVKSDDLKLTYFVSIAKAENRCHQTKSVIAVPGKDKATSKNPVDAPNACGAPRDITTLAAAAELCSKEL